MNKKLLATTAIAGLGLSFAASADVKISGNIEFVKQAVTASKVSALTSDDLEGIESNVSFKASKDTDLGTLAYGFNLENGAEEGAHLQLTSGNVVFHIGSDSFQNLSATVVPNTGENWQTVAGAVGTMAYESSYDLGAATTKNAFGYALGYKVAGGMVSYRHTSSVSGGNTAGAGTASVGNGSNEIMYKGSLGVEGLSVLIGRNTIEATQPNTVDGTGKSMGIAYNFGSITVGASKKDYEDSNTTASTQDEFNTKEYGIGFAVNDNLSLAANYITTDGDNATTAFAAEEKIKGVGIGYNLGGIALEISYADVENVGGTNGADGEALQIRTVQKF